MRWIPSGLLSILALLSGQPWGQLWGQAWAAEVFIGGVGPGFALLADPAVAGPLRATGRIRLYQHANGMDGLSPARRSAMWTTWGLSGFGAGDTVGEVGSPGPGFLRYADGHTPAQVNANEEAVGRSRYTAGRGDAHPGQGYDGYTGDADLAELKAHIAFYRAHGAKDVAIVSSPNGAGADLDDPFPSGTFWANLRAAAELGGAIALDTPPTYALARGPGYLANAAEMVAWGNANGLRTSVIVSPWALAPDAQGRGGNCGLDPTLLASTRTFVAFLQSRNALPSQWVVENYCLDGATNDVDRASGPDSLNEVAKFLASLPDIAGPP